MQFVGEEAYARMEAMLTASLTQSEAWSFLLYVLAACIIIWTVLGGAWLFLFSRRMLTDHRECQNIRDHERMMNKCRYASGRFKE